MNKNEHPRIAVISSANSVSNKPTMKVEKLLETTISGVKMIKWHKANSGAFIQEKLVIPNRKSCSL